MKLLLIPILFFVCFITAKGQDTLVKKDGQQIRVKILEITPEYIKYKKFDNLEGPLFTIIKNEIQMIHYENGTSEVLSKKTLPEENNNVIEVQYNKIGDKINNPTTVTYSKVGYEKKVHDKGIFNLIKANPLLIFAGDIPIYYENRLSDNLGYEVGVGLTLMDYLYYLMMASESDVYIYERKAKAGYSFVAALHFYPSKYYKALEDVYFAPEFRIREYNSVIDEYEGFAITPGVEEKRTMIDFQLKMGYITYWNENLMCELYAGVGIRKRNVSSAYFMNNGNSITVTPYTESLFVPAISAGMKIGFGF